MYYVSSNKKILVNNHPRLKFHVLNHPQKISDNNPRYHFLHLIRRILGTQPVAWTPMNFSSRSKSVMRPKRSIKSVDAFGLGCTGSVTPWRLHMHLHPAINNARWRGTRGRMTNQVWVEGIHRSCQKDGERTVKDNLRDHCIATEESTTILKFSSFLCRQRRTIRS